MTARGEPTRLEVAMAQRTTGGANSNETSPPIRRKLPTCKGNWCYSAGHAITSGLSRDVNRPFDEQVPTRHCTGLAGPVP
jgi:hypothetical protein